MNEFLNLLVSGSTSGGVYALLAVGLVLAYKTSGIFNFGHGAIAFACAYVSFQLSLGFGWSPVVAAVVVVVVIGPFVGFVWDALVFRRLAGATDAVRTVATVGVMIIMPAITLAIFDFLRDTLELSVVDASQVFAVPGLGSAPPRTWQITSGAAITEDQIYVLVAGAIVMAGLHLLLHRTRLGLEMQATVDSPRLAELRGTSARRTSRIAWMLSCALASLAGVFGAPLPGFALDQFNYTVALFAAATAAVIARFRSLPIAFGAALGLGALRSLATGYLTEDHLGAFGRWIEEVEGLRASLPFWLLLGMLVLLGASQARRAGTIAIEAAPPVHHADLSRLRRIAPWCVLGALIAVEGLFLAQGAWLDALLAGMALAVVFLSFTVVTGLGGMVSLAQAAFVTASALIVGRLLTNGWPFIAAVIVGMLFATALGLLVALPALRLGGLPLTLATLALALLADQVLFRWEALGGVGTSGWDIPAPVLGPLDLGSERQLFAALAIAVLGVGLLVGRLPGSTWGRAMIAIRMAEPAAASSGVSAPATKLVLFGLSAAIAGFGGALLAVTDGAARWTTTPPSIGFVWLAVAVTWGVRRPAGAVLAGLSFTLFPLLLNRGFTLGWLPGDPSWSGTTSAFIVPIFFGMGAVTLAKNPEGVLAKMSADRREKRLAKAAREAGASASAIADAPVEPIGHDVLLALRNVHAGYGDVPVLHGVDLDLRPGEVLGIVGPNGAGKSTMVATIAGAIDADAGEIHFAGEDVTSVPVHERARAGLVVVPESRGVFGGLDVEDNLRLWLPADHDRDLAVEPFEALADRRGTLGGSLSGGEQQMLSLAPLLVRPPKVLVIDEATLGLAPLAAHEVIRLLGELRSRGVAIVIVAEKVGDVLRIADRVSVIRLGMLSEPVDVDDVRADDLAAAYLGSSPSPDGSPQAPFAPRAAEGVSTS